MKIYTWIRSRSSLVIALVVAFSAVMPFLKSGIADAALVTSRSIQMSSSASGASASYLVSFNIGTTGTTDLGGIVVDFCGDSPIIGSSTCTTPTSFTLGTPTVSGQDSNAGCVLTGFTTVGTLNSARTLTLTNASPVSTTAGSTCSFTINGVTNPATTNTSFYARIYTYATAAGATSYTVATPGAYIDSGGIALSTAAQITITAKVQEQLTFCVYTSGSCGGGGTAVTLGTNGVLSSTTSYVDKSTQYNIQTNAGGGAVVNVKGATLTSGGATIPALTTATAYLTNTSEFGICTYESSGSNLTAYTGSTLYSGGTAGKCSGTTQGASGDNAALFYYGTAALTGTYGDTIATATAGPSSTGTIPMMAATSTTQQAGIYNTTLTFIATGTY